MFRRIIHFCKITLSASPMFFIVNTVALLILALSQLGIKYSFKIVTDYILEAQVNGLLPHKIMLPMLFFFLMTCIGGNTRNMEELLITTYTNKSKKIFAKLFLHKSYQVKQDDFYNHTFYDNYAFVKNNIENTSKITVTIFNKLIMAIYSFVLSILTISYFNPLIVVYMTILSIGLVSVNRYIVNRRLALEETHINDERQARYYQELLVSRTHSKELRIFGLRERFLKKWQESYNRYRKAKYKFEVKATLLGSLAELIQFVMTYGFTMYFLYLVSKRQLQVGEFVFLNSMIMTLTVSISNLINIATKDLTENYKYVEKYEVFTGRTSLKDLNEMDTYTLNSKRHKVGAFESLTFKNVSYKYPQGHKNAVSHLDFTLQKGEVVSLLGYNGSGKTTFSKLMSGLLEDYEGCIELNGVDIKTIDLEDLYTYFGIGFQDFSKYSLSLKENVAVGMIEDFEDDKQIQKAIEKGNLEEVIHRLPDGIETILGKEYDVNGQDLSGGQWQRIILARAYMGEPDVLILDEPTASIDPLEEMRMLEQFKAIASGKTVLLISHRIGFARMVDRICIMRDGHIVESGTHDELLKLGGRYYTLFIAQQELYKEDVVYA